MHPASRILPVLAVLCCLLAACSGEIYLRDGVTDGDTFYLAERALSDDDPALQSWVSYSLTLAACKLSIGGDNPARASSYDCELTARRHLLETWHEHAGSGGYLDTLAMIDADGWLPEYVGHFLRKKHWKLPQDLDSRGFQRYLDERYPRHRPQTRIVGSWNYAERVQPRP